MSGPEWVTLSMFGVALTLVPGALLVGIAADRRRYPEIFGDAACVAALAVALTLSLLPGLWMLATGLALPVTATATAVGFLALIVLDGALLIRVWQRSQPGRFPALRLQGPDALPQLILLALLLVGLAVRVVAVGGLAYPAWVDSPHHDLIVRLMAQTGQVPVDYAGFMPVASFSYHFGFHVLAVAYVWLTGLASPDAILILGQVLNALMPLSAYAFAKWTTRSTWVGVGAATIVGLISLFPAYYVSWGRYTQLTGLIILGPLLGLLTVSMERRGWDRGAAWQALLIGVLAAGLMYAHYRVLAFAVTFGLALVIVWRRLPWRIWLVSGGVALALSGPWLWRLFEVWVAPRLADPASYLAATGYNDFPWQYFNGNLERGWWILAAAGALIGLIRRERAIWLLAVWTALTSALLNLPGAGSWVVNNNSWAISAFLPGSVAAGYALEQIGRLGIWLWRARQEPDPTPKRALPGWLRRPLGATVGAALAALIAVGLILGIPAQLAAANPRTTLALPADRDAMAWLRANLPDDAVVVVNSWYWQDGLWSASDGGIWIWTEAGLDTTTPPADYYYDPAWARQINEWNARWSALTELGSAEARGLLNEAGATHVYLGAVPGRMKPEMLAAAPDLYRLIYDHDGVRVYQIER